MLRNLKDTSPPASALTVAQKMRKYEPEKNSSHLFREKTKMQKQDDEMAEPLESRIQQLHCIKLVVIRKCGRRTSIDHVGENTSSK